MNNLEIIKTRELVKSIPEKVINNLTNFRIDVRSKALSIVIGKIDKENGKEILQTLPLYFAREGEYDVALSFIETMISNGHYISLEVLNEVYGNSVNGISEPELPSDFEFAQEVNKKINLLVKSSTKSDFYKNDPSFFLFLGKEFERKGDYTKAITYYDKLIELGFEEGYLYCALAHKELGNNEFALSLLEQGYNIYSSKIFLENIIRTYCELGNINKAKQKYVEMISSIKDDKEELLPFIMYSLEIENDYDLKTLEGIMVGYISDNQLIPLEPLLQISRFAESYIDQNIEYISFRILELEKNGLQDLDLEVQEEYDELIKRKLFLMQTSLTILKDNKYLKEHLDDLDKLAFSRVKEERDLLVDYFGENYSLLAFDHGIESQKMNMDLYDNLSNYLGLLSELFFHGKNYNVLSKKLFPLLLKSDNQGVDGDENHVNEGLTLIKKEADYIDTFSPFLSKLYNELIEKIDVKYGKFLRVRIQELAREDLGDNEEAGDNEDKYPKVLYGNKEIALLFWIERMISGNFVDNLDEDFYDNLMNKYGFELLGENDACLLTILMYDKSFDFAINYILSKDLLLKNTVAIYYLLEAFVNYDDKKYLKDLIKTINEDIKESSGARGIFDYIRRFIVSRFKKEDISDEEKSYLLMCSGNLSLLQNKGGKTVLANFQEADKYESVEAINQVGNIYELNGYSDEAFIKYKEAFTIESNIDNLSKIISVLLTKKDFQEASKYIQLGLKSKYDMDLYLFSYNLWQGNLEIAFNLFIGIINKNIPLIDTPEGTLDLLGKKCFEIINGDFEETTDLIKLKLLSSYILPKLELLSENSDILDIIYNEGLNIFSMLDNVKLDELQDFLNKTLYPICLFDPDIPAMFDGEINTIEKAIQIVDYYAFHKYKGLLEEGKNAKTLEKSIEVLSRVNSFIFTVTKYFSKFPESSEIIGQWNKRYVYTKHEGVNIMSEHIYGSSSIN
ncbi:MAG: hypothetical protein PHH98_00110 [Candidatus Gracilibacteria bacterium]|nr:hypothetical protein [Candidatus Gracilibacteria bacterium]